MEIQAELRQEYREERASIEDRLLSMGHTVLGMLGHAAVAVEAGDAHRGAVVRRTDERLQEESRNLQDAILRMVALQAPVASELRIVALYLFANLHLARMGELCGNVARSAGDAQPDEDPQVREQVQEMATQAGLVIETALRALSRRDPELARTLPGLDDPLDQLNRSIFRRTTELVTADGQFDWAMRLVLVARYLERMADHAVDIGEQVIYAATGTLERLS